MKTHIVIIVIVAALAAAAQSGAKSPTTELSPSGAEVMQPADLVKLLQSKRAKPVVLYVGPQFLYTQAHIPGAEFIGPASDAQSADKLRKRVSSLPKKAAVVLYCGCCPWDHCPNIRPAYKELRDMGFAQVKALYLATSFGTDWVDKGYPVEKGEAR